LWTALFQGRMLHILPGKEKKDSTEDLAGEVSNFL